MSALRPWLGPWLIERSHAATVVEEPYDRGSATVSHSQPQSETAQICAPEALQRELDERFAERMARHQFADAGKKADRTQRAEARKHGLRKRHATKLLHIEEKS